MLSQTHGRTKCMLTEQNRNLSSNIEFNIEITWSNYRTAIKNMYLSY